MLSGVILLLIIVSPTAVFGGTMKKLRNFFVDGIKVTPMVDDKSPKKDDGDSWLNRDVLYYAVLVILVILVFVVIPMFE